MVFPLYFMVSPKMAETTLHNIADPATPLCPRFAREGKDQITKGSRSATHTTDMIGVTLVVVVNKAAVEVDVPPSKAASSSRVGTL